jgi:hypothetical protein
MEKHDEQERDEPELEDLDVPEEDADEIGGGRNPPGSDPVPIPYPN